MRFNSYWSFVFLLAIFGLTAFSQDVPTTYTLGPEDSFTVTVLKHPEFSGELQVDPDGMIDLPAIGKLSVLNKTIDDVRRYIITQLSARLQHPDVSVMIRPRIHRVYILGAVHSPGIVDLKANWRVTEVLAAVGGLSVEPGDCTASLMRANNGQQIPLNIPDILAEKPEADVFVHPGDVLTFKPIELIPIFVMGKVQKTGLVQIRPGQGTVEAINQAGGLTLPANEIIASIQRDNNTLPVDVTREKLLQRGDIVNIDPLRSIQVLVTGQVKTPGTVMLKAGEGVFEAVILAGGANDIAELSHVKIVRANGASELVNLSPSFIAEVAGKPIFSPPLNTGDMVMIPENTHFVAILGCVKSTGRLLLTEAKTYRLSDAFIYANGPLTSGAQTNDVLILRQDRTGQSATIHVKFNRFLNGGDMKYNPAIQSGDIVYVPNKHMYIDDVLKALSSVSIFTNNSSVL